MSDPAQERLLPAWSLPAGTVESLGLPTDWPGRVTREWAWGDSTGKGVRVCILDSGIDADHPMVGEIEGAVVKSGGLGFEGLTLELLDASGKVVTTTQTDYDGYFLFERVAYGRYTVRVAEESAQVAKIASDLHVVAEVSEDKSVARLG